MIKINMEKYIKEAKQIFKVGDKVYHIEYGWGEVYHQERINFPVCVKFREDEIMTFTLDGRETSESKQSLLSFTEYTLQGFSQERPIELPEIGELCLVSDSGRDWYCIKFGGYNPKVTDPYTSLNGDGWRYIKRIKILD